MCFLAVIFAESSVVSEGGIGIGTLRARILCQVPKVIHVLKSSYNFIIPIQYIYT